MEKRPFLVSIIVLKIGRKKPNGAHIKNETVNNAKIKLLSPQISTRSPIHLVTPPDRA